MKIIWAVVLSFSVCALSTIANAETWSCDYREVTDGTGSGLLPVGKTSTQKWTVANGRMAALNAKSNAYLRVTLNDDRFLIAFHQLRQPPGSTSDAVLVLVIIEKKTGGYLEINNILMSTVGKGVEKEIGVDSTEPAVETGRCTLLER
jgi:hypothetical protein